MSSEDTRTKEQKIAIFGRFFSGLKNVYGTYDPTTGRDARQVKEPVTDAVFLAHLQGRKPYGVYLLVGDRTGAVVADFDDEDLTPPMEFVKAAGQYGIHAYIERSKSKGYHAWIFLDEAGVSASKARLVVRRILDEIGKPHTEVFPKQDRLDGRTSYGNFINAPLFGAHVLKGRTVFVDPADPTKPFPNQWDFLETTQRVTESTLDDIIELNQLAQEVTIQKHDECSTLTRAALSFGLPPCARRMLSEGVTTDQRVACFRLAVHLRKAGLPLDAALAAMTVWAPKNRPQDGKRIILPQEIIEQTTSAYSKDYRGCGCGEATVRPYCDSGCAIFQKRFHMPPRGGRPAQGDPSGAGQTVSEPAEKEPQDL
jgi:hypothetical protein